MTTPLTELEHALNELEYELQRAGVWQAFAPSAQALESREPFALDTLEPHEWLQWIFIPKMSELLAREQVPNGFSLTPYFEQAWIEQPEFLAVIRVIRSIDEASHLC
ncbi:YqcC family protein [Vibrio tritonius]|uniref:YqcC family protein n=1 Tax=Vibrio tritonius TaxID=1435069 RepID=A0ABS7YFP2_9VIBR|nr:YqcC family protein [Vibrio tritonius]MCA2014492.1 YqcC family protein [Vibrio tritonius]